MSKPTVEELFDEDRFEQLEKKIPYFRDRQTGNLYFLPENEDVVLDRFIQFVDAGGGVGVLARRRSRLRGLGPKLLRGAVAILASKELRVPLPIAQGLLELADEDQKAALALWDVVQKFEDKDYRSGALALIDWLGPRQARAFVESIGDDTRFISNEEFAEEVKAAVGL